MADGLRFAWAALARDGGEYGLPGAFGGGILWAVILVALIIALARTGVLP